MKPITERCVTNELLRKEITELKLAAHRLLWEIVNRDSDVYESDAYHKLEKLLEGK